MDNRANQMNPQHVSFQANASQQVYSQSQVDNRANQLNPNHPTYFSSRSNSSNNGKSGK